MESYLGRRFGLLVSLGEQVTIMGYVYEKCRCDCGSNHNVLRNNLKMGRVKSCGCTRYEHKRGRPLTAEQKAILLKANTSHGFFVNEKSNKRFYTIWAMMKQRCHNPKQPAYARYGARGIRVCERWHSFENFMNDMFEGYKSHIQEFGANDTSIDRIDGNFGYSLENCRWATKKEQANNQTKNVRIVYKNVSYTREEFGRIYRVSKYLLLARDGKDLDEILFKDKEKAAAIEKKKRLQTIENESRCLERWQVMKLLRGEGATLEEIGKMFSITRQRVQQILDKV